MTDPIPPEPQPTPGYTEAPTIASAPPFTAPQPPPSPRPTAPTTPPTRPARRQRRISRRAVLLGAAGGAVAVGALGAGAGYALTHWPGLSGGAGLYTSEAAKITHLLRRAGFGASPADLNTYLHLGLDGAINQLLNYTSVANDVDQALAPLNVDFTNRRDQIFWWLARMTMSQRPLEEKMTLFWHGVLTSSFAKIGGKDNLPLIIQQNNLLRANAMGRFDDLMLTISTDPAMLWWLDGRLNTGNQPNENYSRELMELFTMGIGNYTQDDVHLGSKALSGWVIRNGKGVFAPRRFYTGDITYLGHTGHLDLNDVITILCAKPATATHLSRRMWSFFVWDNPSDSDIQPLVDAYNSSNHQIAAMVKAMLNAPAFFSDKAYRARVKSPAEFVVGAIRAMGFAPNRQALGFMAESMLTMGQTLFDPPNVAGWPGDMLSSGWMSTQAWITRVNFVNTLLEATSGVVGRGPAAADASVLQKLVTEQGLKTTKDILTYFGAILLDGQLASDRQTAVLDALGAAATGPTVALAGGGSIPAVSLRQGLYLMMSMPEYHLN